MHAIERLRYIARASEDEDPLLLAEEAAFGLAALSDEPRALVPASRRLLEAHPSCGPLWWISAQLLVADSVPERAHQAVSELADDPTPDELASAFSTETVVVVAANSSLCLSALGMRPDLAVRLVGSSRSLRSASRRFGDLTADSYLVEELDDAIEGAGVVLVEGRAAGPSGVVVDRVDASLAARAGILGIEVWAAVGAGRLLPTELFSSLLVRALAVQEPCGDDAEELYDMLEEGRQDRARRSLLEPQHIRWVIGPTGVCAPIAALSRTRCPSPAELALSTWPHK